MKCFDPHMIHTIQEAETFLITTHIHPDGDAIGSLIGLTHALRKKGASVDMALSTEIGERFEFLVKKKEIIEPSGLRSHYDVAIILDIGSENRTGFQEQIRALDTVMINIDHHATNEGFAQFDHVDVDAASTSQIVYYLIKEAGLPLDVEVAEGLYLGMVTDSRNFQNANVSYDTFTAAAELLRTGIKIPTLTRFLTQNRSVQDLKVLGLGLSRLKTVAESKIVYTDIRREHLKEMGANHRHAWSSGIFGYLITLSSVVVAVTFVESEENLTYCEFRAKEGFDVSRVAVHFGGGGHKAAAGCSQQKQTDEFIAEVIAKLEIEIRDFRPDDSNR